MAVAFEDIAEEFRRRIQRVVWCSMTTIDERNRTRVRIVHPLWEGSTGWITTKPDAPKGRHLAQNPHLSLCYLEVLDPWGTEQVYVEGRAAVANDKATKEHVWKLIGSEEPPLGFDPTIMWKSPEDPDFGLLKVTPWRIELVSLRPSEDGWKSLVWNAAR